MIIDKVAYENIKPSRSSFFKGEYIIWYLHRKKEQKI